MSGQSGALYSPLCHTAKYRSHFCMHAVSFAHMMSPVVTGVSHMITPALPELLQVTREAAGSKPLEALGSICSADWGHLLNCCTTSPQHNKHPCNHVPITYTRRYILRNFMKMLRWCITRKQVNRLYDTSTMHWGHSVQADSRYLTWIRASTLSCTIVGGLFFGEMTLTSTPSTKSLLVTKAWKRWPQFFTHVSRTCRVKKIHDF